MIYRVLPLLAAAVLAAYAQESTAPTPPKSDLPYLKHADNLVPTELVQAQEQKKKDESTYVIAGAASSTKTPLPIFIFASEKIPPESLQLFKLQTKSGHREITIGKKGPDPIRLQVTHLSGNLYRIEVYNELEPGEYSLSPNNSNLAFCFAVF
jgi:hypothetical protein